VAFGQHTLRPFEDCRYALQETSPPLARLSGRRGGIQALHRCFQRHGVSRLPLNEQGKSVPKKQFKD